VNQQILFSKINPTKPAKRLLLSMASHAGNPNQAGFGSLRGSGQIPVPVAGDQAVGLFHIGAAGEFGKDRPSARCVPGAAFIPGRAGSHRGISQEKLPFHLGFFELSIMSENMAKP